MALLDIFANSVNPAFVNATVPETGCVVCQNVPVTAVVGIDTTSTCISLPEIALSNFSTADFIAPEFVSVIVPETGCVVGQNVPVTAQSNPPLAIFISTLLELIADSNSVNAP